MIRNILALVGLVVVVQAAYKHYEEFSELKRQHATGETDKD